MSEQKAALAATSEQIPETLTVKEVQQILRLGRNAVYNLIHSNSFPVIRIGNLLRIPKKPFYEWLSKSHVVNY